MAPVERGQIVAESEALARLLSDGPDVRIAWHG